MTVRKFMPVNRLAGVFGDANGMLVSQALEKADANLESARPRYAAALEQKLDRLSAATEHNDLYRLARDVGGDAGALGFASISQAAFSLCDLLVSDIGEARMQASIAVHINAIAAFAAAGKDGDTAQSSAVLRGLFSLSGRVA